MPVYLRQPLFIVLILLYASTASAHPGKTDYQDGHTCQKNCEEWDLGYDEYHLHDRDRNPIRLGSQKKPVSERMPQEKALKVGEPMAAPPAPEEIPQAAPQKEMPVQASVQGRGAQLPEEGMLQLRDIMLIVIAGLLVVVLLVLRTKKSPEK
jgi:hypothetical protein